MPFTIDLHENLINEEGIAISTMLSFQFPSVKSTELDAPPPDRFSADYYSTLS
jgi:hypothetical protein